MSTPEMPSIPEVLAAAMWGPGAAGLAPGVIDKAWLQWTTKIVAALERAGFRVVPVEATERMANRGLDLIADRSMAPTEECLEIAGKVWRTMIDVAPR